jgi:hypothetical protein
MAFPTIGDLIAFGEAIRSHWISLISVPAILGLIGWLVTRLRIASEAGVEPPDAIRSALLAAQKWVRKHKYGLGSNLVLITILGSSFFVFVDQKKTIDSYRPKIIVDKAQNERLAKSLPVLSKIITSKAIPLYDAVRIIAEEQSQQITIYLNIEQAIKGADTARDEAITLSNELTQFLADNNYDIDELRPIASPDGTGPNNLTETLGEYLQALQEVPPNPTASEILKAKTLWQAKNLLAFRNWLYSQWIASCVENVKKKRAGIEAALSEPH